MAIAIDKPMDSMRPLNFMASPSFFFKIVQSIYLLNVQVPSSPISIACHKGPRDYACSLASIATLNLSDNS